MSVPNRTNSDSYFGAAWNQARETLRSHEPIRSPGLLTSHTIHGVVREPEAAPGRYGEVEAAGAPGRVKLYRLKSVAADSLTAAEWDGVNDGAVVAIAKPYKLRESITSAVLDGVTINYGYFPGPLGAADLNRIRLASSSGLANESQIVVPRWLLNDLIFAAEVEVTGAATAPTLIDLNVDGRAWARKF